MIRGKRASFSQPGLLIFDVYWKKLLGDGEGGKKWNKTRQRKKRSEKSQSFPGRRASNKSNVSPGRNIHFDTEKRSIRRNVEIFNINWRVCCVRFEFDLLSGVMVLMRKFCRSFRSVGVLLIFFWRFDARTDKIKEMGWYFWNFV